MSHRAIETDDMMARLEKLNAGSPLSLTEPANPYAH